MPSTAALYLGRVTYGATIAVGLYAVALGALLTPSLQRFALYAHKVNTLFLNNLNDPREFGFGANQVTPFTIRTPDGVNLYAWHVLPADIYARHEDELRKQKLPDAPVADMKSTTAFKLLTSNDTSPARVIISFHGNAGHIAQGWRTDTFRYLTTLPNTHVLTVDYRGFGYSTGSPTEPGLITDGVALVNWVLHVANIPPERVVILGQSLGTAVASAVGLHFVDPDNELIPSESREVQLLGKARTAFAGIVLVAPFSNLPSLLLTYRIGGFFPILLPLRPFPALAKTLTSQMVDKWPSGERLTAYYTALTDSPALHGSNDRTMGAVQIFHALNDFDISYHQTERICKQILGDEEKCIDGSDGPAVLEHIRTGRPRLRFQILEYGGHNRIITYSPVMASIARACDDLFS